MSLQQINGIVFKQMVINGANNLANHSKYVDQLNVFLFQMVIRERI